MILWSERLLFNSACFAGIQKPVKPFIYFRVVAFSSNRKKTHYETLGVSQTASTKEIKDAFIELSKKHHPDTSNNSGDCFQLINEAYSVLSKEESRQEYDFKLKNKQWKNVRESYTSQPSYYQRRDFANFHFNAKSHNKSPIFEDKKYRSIYTWSLILAAIYFFSVYMGTIYFTTRRKFTIQSILSSNRVKLETKDETRPGLNEEFVKDESIK